MKNLGLITGTIVGVAGLLFQNRNGFIHFTGGEKIPGRSVCPQGLQREGGEQGGTE